MKIFRNLCLSDPTKDFFNCFGSSITPGSYNKNNEKFDSKLTCFSGNWNSSQWMGKNNAGYMPLINSRYSLKDYLESKVFQNSAGFLRICPDSIMAYDPKRRLSKSWGRN